MTISVVLGPHLTVVRHAHGLDILLQKGRSSLRPCFEQRQAHGL
jgi:hypothetical protein